MQSNDDPITVVCTNSDSTNLQWAHTLVVARDIYKDE